VGIQLECFNEIGGANCSLVRHYVVSLNYDLAASQYTHSLNSLSTGFWKRDSESRFASHTGIAGGQRLT
jgi:hypothetical protein